MIQTIEAEVAPVALSIPDIAPGDRIRVVERIVAHDQTWLTEVEGEVLSCRPESTGAWFALGKNDKLWLLRVRLRKDDGEITALNIDQNTDVQVLQTA
jgi:hypothetical protein